MGVGHSQFLALINIRGSSHQMNGRSQHFGRFLPVFFLIAESGYCTGLIMVAPEQGVPSMSFLHSRLPLLKQLLQRHPVRLHQRPFVPVLIIHFQMMEIKAHGQFFFFRSGVADTVFQCSGRHFPYSDHIVDSCISCKLFQILVDMRTVCIKSSAVAFIIVLESIRFGDQIHYVETEALYALFLPVQDHLFQLVSHFRIVPVQIRLRHIEQVKVPFSKRRHILPCRSAELRLPVRRNLIRCSLPENIVILIFFVSGKGFLEPFMVCGGMVKHHIQHQSHSSFVRLPDQLLHILHRTESEVDAAIIRNIIPIIVLRRNKHRGKPQVIRPKLFQIIQFLNNSFQISQSVSIGIHKRLGINLINHFTAEICHWNSPFLSYSV